MRKYLLAPSENWFRTNLHCHTTLSDGALTPQEVKELYQKRGYSAIAYSDHEKFIPHPELTDNNFVAIHSGEYGIGLGIDPKMPVPEKLKGSWGLDRCYHFNIFATDPGITAAPSTGDFIKPTDPSLSPEDQLAVRYAQVNKWIAACNGAGFLVQLNHPYWSLNIREDWLSLDGLWALEILNYATQRETASDYCPMVYDDMLRFKGPGLHCTMDDDNHNRPGWSSEEHSCGGSTFFAADKLSYGSIVDSMKRGRFFCASGLNPPRFRAVWIEDGKVHAEFSPVDDIVLTGFSRYFQQVRLPGITSADFPVPENEPYFRLTLIDRMGNFANTGAFALQ